MSELCYSLYSEMAERLGTLALHRSRQWQRRKTKNSPPNYRVGAVKSFLVMRPIYPSSQISRKMSVMCPAWACKKNVIRDLMTLGDALDHIVDRSEDRRKPHQAPKHLYNVLAYGRRALPKGLRLRHLNISSLRPPANSVERVSHLA